MIVVVYTLIGLLLVWLVYSEWKSGKEWATIEQKLQEDKHYHDDCE